MASVSVGDVALGMDVYASDGEKVGGINEVYNRPGSAGSDSPHLYMQVDEGNVLELWAQKLYIPFTAIVQLDPGQRVTLDCTKEEAEKQYGEKPAFLR